MRGISTAEEVPRSGPESINAKAYGKGFGIVLYAIACLGCGLIHRHQRGAGNQAISSRVDEQDKEDGRGTQTNEGETKKGTRTREILYALLDLVMTV